MITYDPETWPAPSDAYWRIAHAIAKAEGANRQGTVPDVLNNPGDISDGQRLYNSEFKDGSKVTHFPDKQTGWQWLHDKLERIGLGFSDVYRPIMTWRQIAQEWAGDSLDWVRNVCEDLGVDPDSTFYEFVSTYEKVGL